MSFSPRYQVSYPRMVVIYPTTGNLSNESFANHFGRAETVDAVENFGASDHLSQRAYAEQQCTSIPAVPTANVCKSRTVKL